MAFCAQCGSRVEAGDKFCHNCGAPIRYAEEKDAQERAARERFEAERAAREREAAERAARERFEAERAAREREAAERAARERFEAERAAQERAAQERERMKNAAESGASTDKIRAPHALLKALDKKWIGSIAAGVLALFALVILIGKMGIFGAVKDKANYVTYRNDTACFSVDYPEDYMVTEPNSGQVLITEGEAADFQVSIEYAYYTVGDSAIYSAADFVKQIENDPTVLTDWIGTTNVKTEYAGHTKTAYLERDQYNFWLEIDGDSYEGYLFVYDGQGEFGCYTYMCAINQDAKNAELYKIQGEKMADSFRINGACQAGGYTIYPYDEFDLQFMVRDEAMNKTEASGTSIVIYPVEHVYSESNIWIKETSYKADEDVEDVLEGMCGYFFKSKRKTEYLTQPAEAGSGRYPFTNVTLRYYDGGTWFITTQFVFVHDGFYWNISMKCSEEYYDITATAASDLLFSLKFGNDAGENVGGGTVMENENASDSGSGAEEVIAKIKKTSGFMKNGTFQPLVAVDDFNGDGTQELLAVYEVESGSGVDVMYDVWSLGGKEPVCLQSKVLFREVGGNGGTVGIAKSDGKAYLALEANEPSGDGFDNYYAYIPWSKTESKLGEEGVVYMESHGNVEYPERNRYILGDSAVDKSEFDKRRSDFEWIYRLDIIAGAVDDGVMTFDELR